MFVELLNLTHNQESYYCTCRLYADDAQEEITVTTDSYTYNQLTGVIDSYPGCRYRLSLIFSQDSERIYWGTISVVHAQWRIQVPFRAAKAWIDTVASLVGDITLHTTLPAESASGTVTATNAMPTNTEQAASALSTQSTESAELAESLEHAAVPQIEGGFVRHSPRYIAGLDGLRALAVFGVILYHLNTNLLPGGYLGVTLFFVLSGFLITRLLLDEWRETGTISLRNFWVRRMRRLLPAFYCVVAAILLYAVFFDRSHLLEWRLDALSAVFYVSNWWFVFHHVSYFNLYGTPTPFRHMWSLSVEEQFYFIWPPLFMILAALWKKRLRTILIVTTTAAAASAVLMAMLYQPGFDPSRVYYGTDTNAFSLLIGATLAIAAGTARSAARSSALRVRALDLLATGFLVAILAAFWWMNEYATFTYRGGMVAVSIAMAIVLAAVTNEQSTLGRVLGWAPLRWLGRRSYGIYLWHYPVIALTGSEVTPHPTVYRMLAQVTAAVILAELSWRFVEQPVRKQGFVNSIRRIAQALHLPHVSTSAATFGAMAAMLMSGGIVYAMSGVEHVAPTDRQSRPAVNALHHAHGNADTAATSLTKLASQSLADKPSVIRQAGLTPAVHPPVLMNYVANVKPAQSIDGSPQSASAQQRLPAVTVVGDSIMVDVKPYLAKQFSHASISGKIGRQMGEASVVLKQFEGKHALHQTVVIELGTNGVFPEYELTAVIRQLGPHRHIYLVNTRVPRPWQNKVNEILENVAAQYPNVTMIDWYTASAGHPEYFDPDGVHLTSAGAEAFADLIARTVQGQDGD